MARKNEEKKAPLSARTIRRLVGAPIPLPEVYKAIDSTNNRAKEKAEAGAPSGFAVLADAQTAGRGRLGRRFYSEGGNGLYISVVLRPDLSPDKLPLVTAYAAVAAADALESLCPTLSVGLKWVNDLFLDEKKVGGILTEAAFRTDLEGLSYCVVGIGINLTGEIPAAIRDIAVTVEEHAPPPTRNALAAAIISRLLCMEGAILSGEFLQEYRRRSILKNRMVRVLDGEASCVARVLGIEDDASLRVLTEDGREVCLSAGEVSLSLASQDGGK